MTAEQIALLAAGVSALVQLVKWGGLPARFALLAVLGISAVSVAIWAVAQPPGVITRESADDLFFGWITVSVAAAGVYGFAKGAAQVVGAVGPTPPGPTDPPRVL